MSDQSNRLPADATNIPINYNDPADMVRADLPGENLFISNNGILFAHWKAMPCVIGQDEFDNIRRSHDHAYEGKPTAAPQCENGYIYEFAGYIYGIFVQNSKNMTRWPGGFMPAGTAYITFNHLYRDTTSSAYFSEFDKLIPCETPDDFYAEHSQKVQHSPVGVDRLQFPAHKVTSLIDSDGKRYTQDIDFTVENGMVKWGENRPGFSTGGKPKVYSIRYTYRPYYYVKHVLHEQRLKAEIDIYTQEVKMRGGPTQVMVEQDHVFLQNKFQDNAKDSQIQSGSGGNTGPR